MRSVTIVSTLRIQPGGYPRENETRQLGARVRVDISEKLRALSKRKRISMAVLTEQAIVNLLQAEGEGNG